MMAIVIIVMCDPGYRTIRSEVDIIAR